MLGQRWGRVVRGNRIKFSFLDLVLSQRLEQDFLLVVDVRDFHDCRSFYWGHSRGMPKVEVAGRVQDCALAVIHFDFKGLVVVRCLS